MEPITSPASVHRVHRIDFSSTPHARGLEPPGAAMHDFMDRRRREAAYERAESRSASLSGSESASSRTGSQRSSTSQSPLASRSRSPHSSPGPSTSGPLEVLAQLRNNSTTTHGRSNSSPEMSRRNRSTVANANEYTPLRRHETMGLTRRRRSSASRGKRCRGLCVNFRCTTS